MMNWNYSYNNFNSGFGLLIPLAVADLVLKGFALWKAARKEQNIWFIVLLVVNSLGILPLIYLFLVKDPKIEIKKAKRSK